MRNEKISGGWKIRSILVSFVAVTLWLTVGPSHADDEATVSGSFVANGETVGEILPSDGGEPGKAYLAWVQAVLAVDVEGLKSIVPAEMAEQINTVSAEEARVKIKSMQSLTPTDVVIVGGSSDGTTALLQIEGKIEGDTISADVTMSKVEGFWIPTQFSM